MCRRGSNKAHSVGCVLAAQLKRAHRPYTDSHTHRAKHAKLNPFWIICAHPNDSTKLPELIRMRLHRIDIMMRTRWRWRWIERANTNWKFAFIHGFNSSIFPPSPSAIEATVIYGMKEICIERSFAVFPGIQDWKKKNVANGICLVVACLRAQRSDMDESALFRQNSKASSTSTSSRLISNSSYLFVVVEQNRRYSNCGKNSTVPSSRDGDCTQMRDCFHSATLTFLLLLSIFN